VLDPKEAIARAFGGATTTGKREAHRCAWGDPLLGLQLVVFRGDRAIQSGFEAFFVNFAERIDDLSCVSRRGELREALTCYLRPHVLVVDEVGYLAYGTSTSAQ
jgi:hypothetical protein